MTLGKGFYARIAASGECFCGHERIERTRMGAAWMRPTSTVTLCVRQAAACTIQVNRMLQRVPVPDGHAESKSARTDWWVQTGI